jgi:hypothetical protein
MKRLLGIAMLVCALSVSAFAAKNSETVNFTHTVQVGSTLVPAGIYKVSWTGENATLVVTIARNGKVFATVPAKLETATNPFVSLSTRTSNGTDFLETIQFRKYNLVFASAPEANPNSEAH